MIEILLATYNGEKYLKEQLQSIEEQTYKNWRLIIKDDCSTDSTKKILEEFKLKYSSDKVIINYSKINQGHCKTFFDLLELSKEEIVFFCDQDDIWYSNKIERGVSFLENKNHPILYHSDQNLINEVGTVISESSMEELKQNSTELEMIDYISNNNVTGCTVCLNRELIDLVLKMNIETKKKIRYHDWSIAIIAKLYGEIYYDNYKTMGYRIHSSNASISKNKLSNIFKRNKRIQKKVKTYIQFYVILKYYKNNQKLYLDKDLENILIKVNKYSSSNFFYRLKFNYRYGNWKRFNRRIKKIITLFEA